MDLTKVVVDDIKVYFALITPDQAREMLINTENNFNTLEGNKQRKVRTKTVSAYSKDIKSGMWKVNGETIKLDKQGSVMDGGHRLRAIIESDTPMLTLVVEGIDNDVMDTIDIGLKRSLENALQYQAISYENGAAAIVKATMQLRRQDKNLGQSNANANLSHMDMVDEYQQHSAIYNEAAHYVKEIFKASRKSLKKTEVGAIYVHLIKDLGYDKDLVKEFFWKLCNINGFTKSIYRTTVDNLDNTPKMGQSRIDEYIKCWNGMVRDAKKRPELGVHSWFINPINK